MRTEEQQADRPDYRTRTFVGLLVSLPLSVVGAAFLLVASLLPSCETLEADRAAARAGRLASPGEVASIDVGTRVMVQGRLERGSVRHPYDFVAYDRRIVDGYEEVPRVPGRTGTPTRRARWRVVEHVRPELELGGGGGRVRVVSQDYVWLGPVDVHRPEEWSEPGAQEGLYEGVRASSPVLVFGIVASAPTALAPDERGLVVSEIFRGTEQTYQQFLTDQRDDVKMLEWVFGALGSVLLVLGLASGVFSLVSWIKGRAARVEARLAERR